MWSPAGSSESSLDIVQVGLYVLDHRYSPEWTIYEEEGGHGDQDDRGVGSERGHGPHRRARALGRRGLGYRLGPGDRAALASADAGIRAFVDPRPGGRVLEAGSGGDLGPGREGDLRRVRRGRDRAARPLVRAGRLRPRADPRRRLRDWGEHRRLAPALPTRADHRDRRVSVHACRGRTEARGRPQHRSPLPERRAPSLRRRVVRSGDGELALPRGTRGRVTGDLGRDEARVPPGRRDRRHGAVPSRGQSAEADPVPRALPEGLPRDRLGHGIQGRRFRRGADARVRRGLDPDGDRLLTVFRRAGFSEPRFNALRGGAFAAARLAGRATRSCSMVTFDASRKPPTRCASSSSAACNRGPGASYSWIAMVILSPAPRNDHVPCTSPSISTSGCALPTPSYVSDNKLEWTKRARPFGAYPIV